MNLKKGKFLGAIVLSLFLLSSCKALKNSNNLFQSEYDKIADTIKSVYVANPKETVSSYKIQPHDNIGIRNLQNPEGLVPTSSTDGVQNTALFRVDKDGFVNLPVIGQVNLVGMTQTEAAQKIQGLYGKALIKNPIIEVNVINLKVTLLGEIGKPGNYLLDRENIDLIELLGRSGGLLPSANPKNVKIIRGDRANPEIIYVNLKNVNSLASTKLILQHNDIVYIEQKGLRNISERVTGYAGIIQPAFLVINAILLIYTLGQ